MGINLSMYRAAIGAFSGKSFRFSKSKISVRLLFLFSYLVITLLNLFSILISPNIMLTLTIKLSVSYQRPARMKRFVFANLFKPLCFFMWLHIFSLINRMLLIKAGIEPNPGPSTPPSFSFATFNIDSLLARDGSKLSLIEGIDSINKFDIFGICETYLNETVSNSKIELAGFSPHPIRSDCIVTYGACLFISPLSTGPTVKS